MKLLRYGPAEQEQPAVLVQGNAYDVSEHIPEFDTAFWQQDGLLRLTRLVEEHIGSLRELDLTTTRIGPPVPRPEKLVCIGMNYEDHVRETRADIPPEPVVFMKATNTVVGPHDDVVIPPGSTKTDYEVELAVVVGATCRYLPDEAAARRSIAGYAISNDVSEREFQLERGGQWAKGKSAETFNPLGPLLVTADEFNDSPGLGLRLLVNGDLRQESNTSRMIFNVSHLVWYLSQFMVLCPGDIINTGTPAGIGMSMDPPRFLAPGDTIDVSITGLGSQRQNVRQGAR